jgi:hypothetical protein
MAASFQFRLSGLLGAAAGWAVFLSIAKTFGAFGCFWFFVGLLALTKLLSDHAVRRSCVLVCVGCASLSLGLVDGLFSLFLIVGMLVAPAGALALLGSLKERRVVGGNAIAIASDAAAWNEEDGTTTMRANAPLSVAEASGAEERGECGRLPER